MYDLLKGVKKPWYLLRLSKAVKQDLDLWEQFLLHYNGITIISHKPHLLSRDIHLTSDASKWGFGGTYQIFWIQGHWPDHWKKHDIAVLELYSILMLVVTFGTLLANSHVIFHCDDQAIVAVLNKQTSKSPIIMQLVRPLVLHLLRHNITFRSLYVRGKDNHANVMLCPVHRSLHGDLLRQYGMQLTSTKIHPKVHPDNFRLIC